MNPSPTSHRNPCIGESDLVMCDFDGTISQQDVGIAVIEALNLQEAWEIEMRWRHDEISSMQCLVEQWALVDLPGPELLALFDRLPLDEDFPAFVELCRQHQAGLVIVSDGLDIYVDRMLERLGFRPCSGDEVLEARGSCLPRFANHAELSPEGLTITFPHQTDACASCGNCKTAHLFRLRRHFERTIYIGDGFSDRCPVRYADVVFAKAHLADFCQEQGRPYMAFRNFSDILARMT